MASGRAKSREMNQRGFNSFKRIDRRPVILLESVGLQGQE